MLDSVASILANYLLPYLILSVLAMLIAELVAAVLQHRALVLRRFIRGMLQDRDGTGLGREFYDHKLIKALSTGRYLPSYIPSHLFAAVVSDLVARPRSASLTPNLRSRDDAEMFAELINSWYYLGHGNKFVALQSWFIDVMDGASGYYRLRTLWLLFPIAVAMVGVANFDALRIAKYVGRRDIAEKTALVRLQELAKSDTAGDARKTQSVLASLDSVSTFPLGWQGITLKHLNSSLLGMGISVLAIVLTAPFLFDLLNRFMIVRSTVKPMESIPQLYGVDPRRTGAAVTSE